MTSSLQGWLELLAVKGLGPVTYTRLINRFGSPDAIRSSDMRALVAEGEISPSLARALQQPLSSRLSCTSQKNWRRFRQVDSPS